MGTTLYVFPSCIHVRFPSDVYLNSCGVGSEQQKLDIPATITSLALVKATCGIRLTKLPY